MSVAVTAEVETRPEPPPGFAVTLASFSRAFWLSNVIELFERWAYYGLRGGFLSVYMVTAVALGGLGLNHLQKGDIYMWWALIQSLLPMFTGGYADRYGYRRTVAVAISVTVAGYVLMGMRTDYGGFLAGCMLVATGTAVFKPGIQGILANSTHAQNAPLGWSVFYMVVNVGGFVGPLVTGFLRVLPWKYVFFVSAAVHLLNLAFLLCFRDPASGSSRRHPSQSVVGEFVGILWSSVRNLLEPRLLTFLVVFSGFWLMFMQLFDLLPNFITDWVDSSSIFLWLGNTLHLPSLVARGTAGTQLPAEWMINIDAGAIMLFMLPIGWTFGKLKPVPAMIIGMTIASFGIVVSGRTMSGWLCVLGIFVFAIGEMIASPRKSEYLSLIAPPGKKGLYMGYVSFPQAIGWVIGSKIGGYIYQGHGDKLSLARDYLTGVLHVPADAVRALPPEKVVDYLTAQLHFASTRETTQLLFQYYHPERIWYLFAFIGLVSTVGMLIYNLMVERHRTGTISGEA